MNGAFLMAAILSVFFVASVSQAADASMVLYVSPSGSDDWTGRVRQAKAPDGPFATLARARDELRRLKAAGKLANGATVCVLPGV